MAVPIVFLSHSARDRNIARSLKEVLATHTKGEIEWWLSSDGQSIRSGKNWRAEVEKSLRECRLLFILFTPASQQSAWVHFEAGFAEALGTDVVPIALPGFDIDAIPGPLQHKQGFNLRGASGLNNILSVTNQILKRHDLLSLDDDDYKKVFGDSSDGREAIDLLNAYIEHIELSADSGEKVIEVLASEARQIIGDDLSQTVDRHAVLAGPGFVLREVKQNNARAGGKSEKDPPPSYHLRGEITASGLLELLPVFSSDAVTKLLPAGGSLECTLRRGVAVSTNQARILANMRGTLMRFAHTNVLSFGTVSFAPKVYDANARGGTFVRRLMGQDSHPEPYVPKDLRYQFLLQWESPCQSNVMKELLALLIERQVIFLDQASSAP